MADKKKNVKATRPEDILVEISPCPGCEREHAIVPDRPQTRRNCSRGMGTFTVTLTARPGEIEVEVQFTGLDGKTKDITTSVEVSLINQD